MKNKKIINAVIITTLVVGAGSVFFRLHSTMPDRQNAISDVNVKEEVSFENITAVQLSAMLDNKDFFFVNVHSPYIGEIKDTDEFIFLSDIKDNLDKFPSDKSAKIVVYCQSGGMSGIAAQDLADLGYTNVLNLSGGMISWKKMGYELDYVEENKI